MEAVSTIPDHHWEETKKLVGNDNNTKPLHCGSSLWNAFTHPVINPSLTALMMAVVGFSGTSLVLPTQLDCLEDCDPGGLGPVELHISLISIAAVLGCLTPLAGIVRAKQRSDDLIKASNKRDEANNNLIKARSAERIEFGTEEGALCDDPLTDDEGQSVNPTAVNFSSYENKQPGEETRLPLNPLTVAFISSVGAIPCGLGIGTIVLLLSGATLLSGSGYDVSDIKAGSNEMWGVLAGLFAALILGGCLIYRNQANTTKTISATESINSDTNSIKSETILLEEEPIFFEKKGPINHRKTEIF